MDIIQKVLIKAGRKDLAQEYFEKIAKSLEEMVKDADKIKAEYNKLKDEAGRHPNNKSLQARLTAKEEQLRRVAEAIRSMKAKG